MYQHVLISVMAAASLSDTVKDSINNIVQDIILAIPQIIAALIIIFVAYWIGKSVGFVVTRILSAPGLVSTLETTSIGRALKESGLGVPKLIGNLIFAFIAVLGIAIGLQYLELGPTADYYIGMVADYLPKLVGGLIVLTLGLVFVEVFTAYLSTVFSSLSGDNRILSMLPEMIKIALIIAVVVIGLDIMELSQFTVLYGIVLGFFIIALGIYITDTVVDQLAKDNPDFAPTLSAGKFILYTVFLLIGMAGIFSDSPLVISVIEKISWAFAIAAALVIIPIIYKLAKQ